MKFLTLFTVILCILMTGPVSAVEVTFESLKELIKNKNERLTAQRKSVVAAKKREGVLSRSFLPTLGIDGGYETFTVGSTLSKQQPYYGVTASVNVYNGGRDRMQGEVQDLNTQSEESEVKIVLAQELSRARELFWKIVYLKEEFKLLDIMLGMNIDNLKSANRRIKSGVASPSDRLEFQMKALDLRRDKNQVQSEQTALSMELLVMLGSEVTDKLQITAKLQHVDEWEHDLEHTHLDHDFFNKPSEILAKQLEIKKLQQHRRRAPKIDLYASWHQFNQREEAHVESRERQESAIGVKLSLALFDGFSTSREVSALSAEAAAAAALSRYNKLKNEAQIEGNFLRLRILHDQVHDAEKHIAMARGYYKATLSEYSRGVKNSPDVLGATDKLEEVTRTKNQLIRDFHIARSRVLSKIGR